MVEQEIWKTIPQNENYMVSNKGRVKSLDHYVNNIYGKRLVKGKLISGAINSYGYNIIRIAYHGKETQFFVHRLVAQMFIPNPLNKPQINHKDGNKLNNCVENLEWATALENVKHEYATGLNRKDWCNKPVVKKKNGIIVERFESVKLASKSENITHGAIIYRIKHKSKKNGYEWGYENE